MANIFAMANNFSPGSFDTVPLSIFDVPGFSSAVILFIGFIFLAYLIGSIPFGLILTKTYMKKDIRTVGSGNIGATNVLRMGSKKLALLTLFFDGFKGAVLILFMLIYSVDMSRSSDPLFLDLYGSLQLFFGFVTILGHCFPIWLKFKGGKGVATALGVLLAAVPYAGLAACAAWLITAFLFKYSSMGALIAVAVAPVVTVFVYGPYSAFICLLITLLVWWRHKENIKRLLNGTEPKIGSGRKKTADVGPAA